MARKDELQQQYRDNIAALEDIKKRRNPDGTFPADVQEQISRNNADYERIFKELGIEEQLEKREKEALLQFHNRPDTTSTTSAISPEAREQSYSQAFVNYLVRGKTGLTGEEVALLETRGTSTQITTSTTLGGYLVPKQFSNELERVMKYYSVMADYCRVVDDTGMGGGQLEWPTVDDTASTGNINTAANQAAARTVADLTFGQVLFNDWLIDSNIIKISRSLLQDERVALLTSHLSDILGERIGRKANSVWTTGTGTNQPYGLTTTVTTSAVTSAGATALTAADLLKAQAAIDYSYWNGPKTGWMMHQGIRSYLRTIDFSTSTSHIFIPGNLATGEPETLYNWPIFINNDLTGPTNGAPVTATKHIYLGDFSKFIIRKIRDVSIERNDMLYWDSLSVGFMGWMRTDSNLINAKAIKYILQA